MPFTHRKRDFFLIGILFLIAAPGLSIGSIWSRRQHIREFEVAALSPATLADSATRESVRYHLSRLQADEAMRWGLMGDATLGAVGGLAGLVLILWSRRGTTSTP
jgi:hypothetical protein